MTYASSRRGLGVGSWLLLVLVVLLAGAAAALWAAARYDAVARVFGIDPAPTAAPRALGLAASQQLAAGPVAEQAERMAGLETRVARLENGIQQAAGSAGRADALLIAFAARRAVDRGVALGYLEPLLVSRFADTNRGAVATIVGGARKPVRLEQLTAQFEALRPTLQGRAPQESAWTSVQRELGSLISIRHADRPSLQPSATYDRARARLASGQVDLALAEAMRLPGIGRAQGWVADARTYVAVHRALDEIETVALLPAAL